MVVLVVGSTGFIGQRLIAALLGAGHEVVGASRHPERAAAADTRLRQIAADFARDTDAAAWLPRLRGVDVVINAVGILREGRGQTFDAVHVRAPRALFEACAASDVRLVIQLSALGADEHARSRFHLSKKAADDRLRNVPVRSLIVQPSLVYGRGGASAEWFETLASLPLVPLVGRGDQRVQPVHVDDLCCAIVRLLTSEMRSGERVPMVGPAPITMRELLAGLRAAMGLPPPRFLPVPKRLVRLAAHLASRVDGGMLDPEALDMLERGNVAPVAPIGGLLGHLPRGPAEFVAPFERAAVASHALGRWVGPLLRLSIAIVWIVSGVVSFGLYPVQESYALLARVGAPEVIAPWLLYGAAAADLLLGIATLFARRAPRLWLAQIVLVLGYMAIITWRLPEFWLHPFGPIVKNLPMLAALWWLYERDRARWNT